MSTTLTHWLDSLGWALLHSLWQGGIAFLIVVVLRYMLKGKSPSLSYIGQIAVLFSCFLAFLVTLTIYLKVPELSPASGSFNNVEPSTVPIVESGFEQRVLAAKLALPNFAKYTLPIAMLWCVGFAVMALRYTTAYILTNRLRKMGLIAPPVQWQETFTRLIEQSNLRVSVDFYISEYIEGPMTLGFLKPVVLVPVGFLSRLPSDQVEAILLHEIGHIRRYDYAINLVQTAIRTVFFFHPAIHYISKRIDIDREQACDDFACARSPNPNSLVKGLAALTLSLSPNLAMAAVKRDMPILNRLKRLTGYSETSRRPDHAILSTLTAIIICAGYVGAVTQADAHPPIEPKPPAVMKAKISEAKLPDAILKENTPIAPTPPPYPKFASLPSGKIDEKTFKHYLEKDEATLKTFKGDMKSFKDSLWAYSKKDNHDSKKRDLLEEKAERLLDKVEAKLDSRRDALEYQYEAYVKASETKSASAKVKSTSKSYDTAKKNDNEAVKKNRLYSHKQFREQVIGNLLKDGLIQSANETVFLSHPNNVMSLNGKPMPKNLAEKYCKMLEKNGIYDNDVEITIKPKNITVLTDYDGRKHTTKVTYGEWTNEAKVKGAKKKTYAQSDATERTKTKLSKKLTYVWPSQNDRVSAEFGIKNEFWPKSHKGIDIPSDKGTPVYATAQGTVKAVYEDDKYGRTIEIEHDDGRESLYAHLYRFKVSHGQKIRRGQVIGLSGNSGISTGPHLHFEIREDGEAINPRNLLGG